MGFNSGFKGLTETSVLTYHITMLHTQKCRPVAGWLLNNRVTKAEGNSCGLTRCTNADLAWRDWRNPRNTSGYSLPPRSHPNEASPEYQPTCWE